MERKGVLQRGRSFFFCRLLQPDPASWANVTFASRTTPPLHFAVKMQTVKRPRCPEHRGIHVVSELLAYRCQELSTVRLPDTTNSPARVFVSTACRLR